MGDGKINERILKGIRENSKKDKVISDLLIDLVCEETNQPGWWKEIYRKKIQQYSEKWGGLSEN